MKQKEKMLLSRGRIPTRVLLALQLCAASIEQGIAQTFPYQDSPFGFHSAFYRPFLRTGEQPNFEEIYDTTSPAYIGYKEAQNIGVKWERTAFPAQAGAAQLPPYNWELTDLVYSSVPKGINILTNIYTRDMLPGTWQFKDQEAEQNYIEFVKAFVERYDGDGINDMPGLDNPIKYWQIVNEPVINNVSPGQMNLDWEGFAHLMEVSYEAVKSSDPEAKVLMGGALGGEMLYGDPSSFYKQLNEFYLPVLERLNGKYLDIFDIHHYGAPNGGLGGWSGSKQAYLLFKNILDQTGYKDIPVWFTETGSPGFPGHELDQARDVIRRHVYPLSYGVKKVFWAWALVEGYPPLTGEDYFDHTGLVYDGISNNDPGYGVKKLSYYTYKKMVKVLEGSDWNNIQTIQEKDGIYIYKFTKNGKPIWVAWNDSSFTRTVTISGISSNRVKTTEAVPKYESGKDIADYTTAFQTDTLGVTNGAVTLTLDSLPVFVEPLTLTSVEEGENIPREFQLY